MYVALAGPKVELPLVVHRGVILVLCGAEDT